MSNKQRTICILAGDLSGCGGTQRCATFLANALINNFKVILIDFSNKSEDIYFDVHEKIKVIHIHQDNLIKAGMMLRKFLIKHHIYAVINVEAMLGIYSIPATMFLKIKNIIWEHGNYYQKQCKTIDVVRWLEYKMCDYYITLTKRDQNNFTSHFKGKCKTEYIYNPVSLPEKLNSNGTNKILTVGYLREIKGYEYLVDIAEKVLNKHCDWTWEIYGDDTSNPQYVSFIKSKIKQKGLEGKLCIMGTTKNIEACYDNACMLVMTSVMEGLPMTLLEAKAHKLPVVAFDIETGPDEIIDSGTNGFLIKPFDTTQMAEKICELIENPKLRKEFSDNSYIGIEKFDKEKIVHKWLEILG